MPGRCFGIYGSTVDGWTGSGSVTNNPAATDPEDPYNTIWHFAVANGQANTFLTTEDLTLSTILDNGFDFSGEGAGQLVFDIKLDSYAPGTTILVRMDSGYPNVGEVSLDIASLSLGSWQRVSVDFAEFEANPGAGGAVTMTSTSVSFIAEA